MVNILKVIICVLGFVLSFCMAESRVALVIGNSSYTESPLKNSANDATDMAQKLSELGFEVLKYTNVNRHSMRMAIRDFGNRLKNADVGLFYFAGHGIQINGINYLVPLEADVTSSDEVQDESIDASAVLRKMESAGNKVNIVILDACRNNPFPSSFRSIDRGLARMDGPVGSFIAYATSPGSVAADGDGRNGLYTQYLLSALSQPGLSIEQVFKQVRNRVVHATNGKQTPWESSSLMGEFAFFAAVNHAAIAAPVVVAPPDKPVTVGHIQVISNVPLADVVINRMQRGKVDVDGVLNVSNVRGKKAELTVKAEGYLPYRQEIELLSNQWQQVNVNLRRMEKKCYVGKKIALDTDIGRLETNKELTAIQKRQLKLLVEDALTQNQINVVLSSKESDFKIEAHITSEVVPVTAIKTNFKTIRITIILVLIDNKTGETLARTSKEYRKAGVSADEILRNILRQEMVPVVHSLLAKACV